MALKGKFSKGMCNFFKKIKKKYIYDKRDEGFERVFEK
jgi:hypothetical protein